MTCPGSCFTIPGKGPQDDSFYTFVDRFRFLEGHAIHLAKEIKKVVGMRLRRNTWIRKCQAWQSKNVGMSLGLDAELVKVYPLPSMKGKLFFRSLSDIWSSECTKNMIWILKVFNFINLLEELILLSAFSQEQNF